MICVACNILFYATGGKKTTIFQYSAAEVTYLGIKDKAPTPTPDGKCEPLVADNRERL